MNPMHDWVYLGFAFTLLTVATLVTRAGFFMLPARFNLPPQMERALRYAPACALAAIIAQGVLTRDHQPAVSFDNHEMWGLVAAAVASARTRNMVVMMAIGMGVFTALRLWS